MKIVCFSLVSCALLLLGCSSAPVGLEDRSWKKNCGPGMYKQPDAEPVQSKTVDHQQIRHYPVVSGDSER